ncbi:MAG: tRNA 2-thiocytidine biosynthesis protein TtcA [Clostridia bacterium]|nr:tRNA 2-thiocytidine biosynthesis protein TtcA [Clostridia bacterium]
MKNKQTALGVIRRAVENYGMIKPGDRIAVGVSGGKDSTALLWLLSELSHFGDYDFGLEAVTVDPSFSDVTGKDADYSALSSFCERIGVRHTVIKTKIASIVFEARNEGSPCSLCSRLRRGALNDAAEALGCGVLALGHHMDDAAETFMMNLLLGGKVACFSPVTEYEKVRLIRPLIYMREREIAPLCRAFSLPVAEKVCPEDGATERERMKKTLRSLDRDYRGVYKAVVGALERGGIDGWKSRG